MMRKIQSRRDFLATLSAAGGASLIGAARSSGQDERLETTTVRIAKIAGICIAPQYVADELLRGEGFTDIRYVAADAGALRSDVRSGRRRPARPAAPASFPSFQPEQAPRAERRCRPRTPAAAHSP